MQSIYIILTNTGTILSKIIRAYTKDEFAHSSISLDKNLEQMYSFGRLNPYNPFWGGFIHEHIDKGTFKRFFNTQAEIFELKVEDEQYEKIKKIIFLIQKQKENFKFNILGLFGVGFNIKYKKQNSFYCAEFLKYIIEEANIENTLPDLIRPESFKKLQGINKIYRGYLRDYKIKEKIFQN